MSDKEDWRDAFPVGCTIELFPGDLMVNGVCTCLVVEPTATAIKFQWLTVRLVSGTPTNSGRNVLNNWAHTCSYGIWYLGPCEYYGWKPKLLSPYALTDYGDDT